MKKKRRPHVVIHVEKGGAYIANIERLDCLFQGDSMGNIPEYNKQENRNENGKATEGGLCTYRTPFAMAILETYNSGLIVDKKDFAAILQMAKEMKIYDRLSARNIVEVLTGECALDAEKIPCESSIRSVCFSQRKHPDWKIEGYDYTDTRRYINIGEIFRAAYLRLHQ